MRRSDRSMRGNNAGQTGPFPISRRHAALTMLTGLLAGLGPVRVLAEAVAPGSQVLLTARPKSVLLFTPKGAGAQDGHDWKNAMPIGALSKSLNAGRPGSGFLIGFDPADGEPAALDQGQISLKSSGDKDHPLFVEAGLKAGEHKIAAATADAAIFFKSSQPWSLESFGHHGGACYFAINDGASHLRISGFRVDGTPADGFFKFRAGKSGLLTYADIAISNIDARNVGRVIETDRNAMLQNLVIADCKAVGIVRGFARFRNLSDSALRNLELDAANMDAGGKNVCQLIALEGGNNVLFENVAVRNAMNTPAPKNGKEGYVQGDGIVCERKTSNVTIRGCSASNMGDGGFDLKTTNVVIEDSSADSCKYGARIWTEGNNVIRRCDFRNPQTRGNSNGACIQASGTLDIVDTKLQAGPGTAAINLHKLDKHKDPAVTMQGGSIQLDGDAVVASASSSGVLELRDVMVNGVATSHRYVFEKKVQ